MKKEKIKAALHDMKRRYEPFLRNLAPELNECAKKIDIKNFTLNGDKHITIPYYGGPLGFAVQECETTFEINEDFSEKAVYICFGGVDYISTVYVNGSCVGRHEGFFSPFEFEITRFIKKGRNTLRITVENDYVYMGSTAGGGKPRIQGEKMYAATGLGYDDPIEGWHHCPPGMGIYNYVRVEIRNRINITDLYVRPLCGENTAEIWAEVENADYSCADISFNISVYGQNFDAKVIENYEYKPVYAYRNETDDFRVQMNACEAKVKIKGLSEAECNNPLYAEHGKNIYKIRIPICDFKLWTLDSPYLYQAQVTVLCDGKVCDTRASQFGMRSFAQDTESHPKGMFYLNGNKIKLRGANTMGFEQQDVLRGDFEQLIDDILLAKLCNMNFWRLTQRPVQDEVYEYCDRLGLLTQTDLPLFGCMRRTKLAEMVHQTEEMVRIVRKHPCNVVISYINEPVPGAYYKPHRHMERNELEDAFEACDRIAKLNCPEIVIKHVDGDYDPPSKNCVQDNHCYTLWYNAHGIEFGKLQRGWWMDTDKEWYCGCGEYGAEALDTVDLMKRRYPKEWIAEPFSPKNILRSQCQVFHNFFFETPESMEEWVYESRKHQAFATKAITEAFRRRRDMITCAIHLFIDAWPSGWMKTIMDCERTPKPAYFECREAFSPVLISLRSDRFTYFAGEKISVEAYVCNDTNRTSDDCSIVFEVYNASGKKIKGAKAEAHLADCDVTYAANAEFSIDSVNDREKFTLRAILLDEDKTVLSTNEFAFEVFEDVELSENKDVVIVTGLENGEQMIAGETVSVWDTYMYGRHFVSCKTGHRAVNEFRKDDFKYWYNKELDMISPIAEKTFTAKGFTPVLTCGTIRVDATGSGGESIEGREMVVGEKMYNGKRYIISTLDIRCENPIAKRFLKALLES